MSCCAKLLAFVAGVFVTVIAFTLALVAIEFFGHRLDSGLLGICGPYGPHTTLIALMALAGFVLSIVTGVYAARRFYHFITRET
ncbi:MAG TPA: hypothetical protein VJ063_09335 [Verrucomicrobiae bacterium]|nr:hypothetical protein [Verrucomicrobiae bacterium]